LALDLVILPATTHGGMKFLNATFNLWALHIDYPFFDVAGSTREQSLRGKSACLNGPADLDVPLCGAAYRRYLTSLTLWASLDSNQRPLPFSHGIAGQWAVMAAH
jgi:hypothetical protein